MGNITICRLAKDPRFKIKVSINKEINKIKYLDIMTGAECENPDLAVHSKNMINEINDKWQYLIESVKHDKRLYYKISEGMNVIEY